MSSTSLLEYTQTFNIEIKDNGVDTNFLQDCLDLKYKHLYLVFT
jgi:hypothetical protein